MYPTKREECSHVLGDVNLRIDLISKISHSGTKCRKKNSPRYIYRKYGLTSCKSPRRACIRNGNFPKTSTPCDEATSPANQKHVRSLVKKINSLHSKSGSTPRRSSSKKQKPSKHLQMLDLQLARMKKKSRELREKDNLMKNRYELLKQKAETTFSVDVQSEFSPLSGAKVADDRLNSCQLEDGREPIECSVMLDSFNFKRSNLYIRADVCNVYYTDSNMASGAILSPLKTILKDGKKCTFC